MKRKYLLCGLLTISSSLVFAHHHHSGYGDYDYGDTTIIISQSKSVCEITGQSEDPNNIGTNAGGFCVSNGIDSKCISGTLGNLAVIRQIARSWVRGGVCGAIDDSATQYMPPTPNRVYPLQPMEGPITTSQDTYTLLANGLVDALQSGPIKGLHLIPGSWKTDVGYTIDRTWNKQVSNNTLVIEFKLADSANRSYDGRWSVSWGPGREWAIYYIDNPKTGRREGWFLKGNLLNGVDISLNDKLVELCMAENRHRCYNTSSSAPANAPQAD